MADTSYLTELWYRFTQSEDEQLFEELYNHSSTIIFMIAYKYLENKQEAEDVVHDVLTRIYENRTISSHQEIQNFEAWVAKITKNVCYKRIEKIKRRNTEVRQIDDRQFLNQSVYNEGESAIVSNHIRLIIHRLGPLNFTEILNSQIEGYSNPEIAIRLGKSEKYVRDRKHLAKLTLHKHLKYANII